MLPGTPAKKALVTIATDKYFDLWSAHCHANWERWARRRGWEWFVVKRPISTPQELKRRTVHWDKCRILQLPALQAYDVIAWVDADIVINPEAPCLTQSWDDAKIGALCFDDIPEFAAKNERISAVRRRRNPKAGDLYVDSDLWYRISGYRDFPNRHLNTGVLVMRRSRHLEFMTHVFNSYDRNLACWEQTPLSWEIFTAGLHHPLSHKFNTLWELEWPYHYPFLEDESYANAGDLYARCVQATFANTWFLHFNAGDKGYMRHLDHLWTAPPPPLAVFA